MESYNGFLPRFTAEASLSGCISTGSSVTCVADNYDFTKSKGVLTMAACIQKSWCSNTCDPSTGKGENCCWDTQLQDCVCVPCYHPPQNCCGKPRGSPCP
jgi:hypothetical protein